MAVDAYVALYTTTLAATATSVSILAIPATGYRDLRLVMNTTGVNTDVAITFNGSTAANYNCVYMAGQSSGAVSGTSTNAANILFGYVANTDWTALTLDVIDAFTTDKHKTLVSRSSASNILVMSVAGRWASTAAISGMTITATAGAFAVGSTFSLYGIVG